MRSGTTNAGNAFQLRASRPAAQSAYAALVSLVQEAETERAPFVRLADKYALVFLPLTVAAATAAWLVSGDSVRAVAVLVVATPCPLILAAPVALISGLSRAARSGVLVKGGGVIERLGAARTVLLDKTGTLTLGTPSVERIVSLDGLDSDEILRLAASLGDRLRPDAPAMITALKGAGINNVAIGTGDRAAIADAIGGRVGVDRVYSEQTPESKLDVVRSVREREDLRPVVMVGDGVNDAPALALADVGVAIGTAGATISAETADAVITVDRIDRLADAVRIGRRTLGIARQSIVAGIGLSTVAMAFAAAGFIVPVVGALLQEAIDVAVILNALRALRE